MTHHQHHLSYLGIAIAVFFWLFDSSLDVLIFKESENYIDSLLQPEPMELWMRLVVVSLIIGFGLYAQIMIRKLEDLASRDHLTGIFNRRMFYQFFTYEINQAKRQNTALSIIMFDIDCFKYINDVWGHHEGDRVLNHICQIIQQEIRKTDLFARWAGDEFMILANHMQASEMQLLAEKIRKAIEADYSDAKFNVTISLGITQLQNTDSEETMIARADKALYQAKDSGRNQAVVL